MKKNARQAKKQKAAVGGLSFPAPTEVELAGLKPAPYNPRYMPRSQMDALKASLEKHGMVLNLVVQLASAAHGPMVIIGGHQRLIALEELCRSRGEPMPARAWAVVLDVADGEAKQLNIALNRISGEFDSYKLGEIFGDVYPTMLPEDVAATGFSGEEIGQLLRLIAAPDEAALVLEREAEQMIGQFAKSVTLTVEFDTVEQRDQAKEKLVARAKADGKKPGAVIIEMLLAGAARRRGAA